MTVSRSRLGTRPAHVHVLAADRRGEVLDNRLDFRRRLLVDRGGPREVELPAAQPDRPVGLVLPHDVEEEDVRHALGLGAGVRRVAQVG